MTDPLAIDSAWLAANPLPVHGDGTTKDSRGRVLIVGGSRSVPGAVRLTAEAALRAGAGKVRVATIGEASTLLGLLVPEAGIVPLPAGPDGDIASDAADELAQIAEGVDAVVIGPGIVDEDVAARLIDAIGRRMSSDGMLLIDAAAIAALARLDTASIRARLIVTPHHGEMAALTGQSLETIVADPIGIATRTAEERHAVVALKGSTTIVAAPGQAALRFGGGGIGMATGGSGDVLAGAIAALSARGTDAAVAAGWGVWLHGQAGRRAATTHGPIGFLARELSAELPRLLPQ